MVLSLVPHACIHTDTGERPCPFTAASEQATAGAATPDSGRPVPPGAAPGVPECVATPDVGRRPPAKQLRPSEVAPSSLGLLYCSVLAVCLQAAGPTSPTVLGVCRAFLPFVPILANRRSWIFRNWSFVQIFNALIVYKVLLMFVC